MPDTVVPPSFVRSPSVRFLGSLSVDRSLARYDLAGSVAHVEMLGAAELLTPSEVATLVAGLRKIAREISAGSFPWHDELEDVHTNIEARLTELVGPVGGKLHTGRSRNDQIALDERLYLRSAVHDIGRQLLELTRALLARAGEESATPMPGYTHLQRAQPVSVGHWLLAHFWRFDRDLDRLESTARRANVSPLGAGALAGSTLPLSPETVARRLGFEHAFENSIDAVSDRDYFAELLFDLGLVSVHASALGEELVVFATEEFGFLERSPALGSGSSLMPQKRNPDVAELVRGKAGRVIGDLVALLTTLKGLPLAYDRDLQEDKAPVLDAVGTVSGVVTALSEIVRGLRFDRHRLRTAVQDPSLLATDLAEQLVRQGTPFRAAHEAVAELSRSPGGFAAANVEALLGLGASTGAEWSDPDRALVRRTVSGGPAPVRVVAQMARAESRTAARAEFLSSLNQQVGLVEELLNEGAT
jgi:argininosuccinate lyase